MDEVLPVRGIQENVKSMYLFYNVRKILSCGTLIIFFSNFVLNPLLLRTMYQSLKYPSFSEKMMNQSMWGTHKNKLQNCIKPSKLGHSFRRYFMNFQPHLRHLSNRLRLDNGLGNLAKWTILFGCQLCCFLTTPERSK